MRSDSQLLKESLAELEPVADQMVSYFYARLFVEHPPLRSMFPLVMDSQRDRLFRALINVVQGIDHPEQLIPFLAQLGRDHRKYGVIASHYDAIGHCLVAAVREYSNGHWTADTERIWFQAYSIAAKAMIDAAEASSEPAWWNARVISHEWRADQVVVLRAMPDKPYPYQPGQYCSVETPYQPRVWRSYSIANAPRADGMLEFHVRSVGVGWVSGALVRKTQVGDMLRIGPPIGGMVVDQGSHRDIVCVAGGTGLAPMKAIIEGLAGGASERRAHLFFGVRRRDELYDMPALQQLAARHSWLTLVTAVSEDDRYAGERGNLCDVVARHGRWLDHDLYASGSPPMIRSTVSRFRELGVPSERIHHDCFGDV